jgi:hypothetical protein
MSLAKHLLNHTEGFGILSTPAEVNELAYVGAQPLRLQYLKGSKEKMGLALWNVLSPKVPGYNYGPNTGYPTFSLVTLKAKGLI